MNPTRRNVIDNKRVNILSGVTNYYPFYPDNNTIDDISKLLEPFSNDDPYYQVNLRLIKKILSHIIASPDFKLDAFLSVIDTLLSEQPAGQGILIVRKDVAQVTGALLSRTTGNLGAFHDKVVLTMYQVTGLGMGWKAIWVPNINFLTIQCIMMCLRMI